MALLTCRNLCAGYDGRDILHNLNFEVSRGDYLIIVGENGSGKSTLIKTILGLHAPTMGSISFGEGLNKKQIGYLPQQTPVQRDFPASVWEIVLSGFAGQVGFKPFYSAAQRTAAREALEKLHLLPLKNSVYRSLSGGQQQRVLLARAICAASGLLLLDEPVTGLDPRMTQEMYSEISALHEEGMTIIMISHDLESAMRYATHILHLGKTNFYGPKEIYKKSIYFRQLIENGGRK